ncbi:MAG: glycosyl hydrolase [Saprospiraceae bacterium]|nr:glycosyl hydrolase [Saprospiraceae bacterium]
MKNTFFTLFVIFVALISGFSQSKPADTIPTNIFGGLKFRNLSPAHISGRISDLAVNPRNHSEYYVAVSSGNVWKTINNGTTFEPIFDDYGSFSMGCITMDPKSHNVLWLGTGENKHQRSVSYGDGIYKSVDAGKSWTNMGLKQSFQIGKIIVHPDNSDIVFAACEGSVWGSGGERGVYKTEDGGKTWKRTLFVSDNTGVSNIDIDPKDPKIMYASAEQRRRTNATRIGGGPESSLWKSVDGGNTWIKLENGIPGGDKGGMFIAVSPVDNNVVYAMVEAAMKEGGFYRSSDKGATWNKMSDYVTSGQYYCEFFPSPFDVNKIYATETVSKFSIDGGKTWKPIGNNGRHVDDHVFWIDTQDEKHFMIGTDGGLYETFDGGSHYNHKMIPVTQYYRVFADNTYPFYWVYGGTQDNSSMGAPSNTLYDDGISRAEWDITLGGDGFWQAVDPENTNIVYSEYQYGNIYRYDKRSGDKLFIKPQESENDSLFKFHWDAPFILSHFSPSRLYMAGNFLFQTDDRGQSWKKISGDLSTGMDRNSWPVMDRYWGIESVEKDVSTSLYGTAVSLAESPVREGLVFVGTNDGALNITNDGGKTWSKVKKIADAPEYTFISDIEPSNFDENVVYVTLNNHKNFDFKPYVFKSTDKGKTWKAISGKLPVNQPVHSIKQDFREPNLLFLGTEFGLYFTADDGKQWIKMKNGLPTISVRDITTHKGEEDLVIATFGRGFYILDDYSPLRKLNGLNSKEFELFDIKDARLYVERDRGGYGFGSVIHFDANEPFGATFTYIVKDDVKTMKQVRREKEKELIKNKSRIPIPTLEEQRKEKEEVAPYFIFIIKDEFGNEVRKLNKNISKGINRLTWDLRYSTPDPMNTTEKFDASATGGKGMLVTEGNYSLSVLKFVNGKFDTLVVEKQFKVVPLNMNSQAVAEKSDLAQFNKEVREVYRKATAVRSDLEQLLARVLTLKQLGNNTPGTSVSVMNKIIDAEKILRDINWEFNGQDPPASSEERWPQPVPLNDRIGYVYYTHFSTKMPVNESERDAMKILSKRIPAIAEKLDKIKKISVPEIEMYFEKIKAPWTPGRNN